MARSFTICRNVTTTLTRADTVLTLNAFAASVLALLQTGGTYAMGADQVYVQWDNTSFNVVIEDAVMAAAIAPTALPTAAPAWASSRRRWRRLFFGWCGGSDGQPRAETCELRSLSSRKTRVRGGSVGTRCRLG